MSSCRMTQGCLLARQRAGMTLIEMLIATTITLIIMAAVAEVFGLFGAGVSDSRSVIEMTYQMRSVAHRLRQDLAGATAPTTPPLAPEQEQGYFEYIEGPATDLNPDLGLLRDPAVEGIPVPAVGAALPPAEETLTADCDDILLFTSRSSGTPFEGRFFGGTLTSPTAEIGWFCKKAAMQTPGGPTLYTLYRRQLLVTSYVGAPPFLGGLNQLSWPGSWPLFYQDYDLSCRVMEDIAGVKYLLPNTLGDLTKRENRFLHNTPDGTVPNDNPNLFPFPARFDPKAPPDAATGETLGLGGLREGEDVILTNVLAFDVRVFDPAAPIQVRPALPAAPVDAVIPGDPGFVPGDPAVAQGAYVDLNWRRQSPPSLFPLPAGGVFPPGTVTFLPGTKITAFSDLGIQVRNSIALAGNLLAPASDLSGLTATYDTWSTHYESDGEDQDDAPAGGSLLVDEGTNGFDDDGDGLIDEADEAETSAPYPVALRGIEVRIRCYEPSSRQIRQVTVRHTFVPH